MNPSQRFCVLCYMVVKPVLVGQKSAMQIQVLKYNAVQYNTVQIIQNFLSFVISQSESEKLLSGVRSQEAERMRCRNVEYEGGTQFMSCCLLRVVLCPNSLLLLVVDFDSRIIGCMIAVIYCSLNYDQRNIL